MKNAILFITVMFLCGVGFAQADGQFNPSALSVFKSKVLNTTWLAMDGPDGGTSRMQCFNEEDYDAPMNQDGTFPKAIICWRNDTWHGLAGINRAVPVKLRVDPDLDTLAYFNKPGVSSDFISWDANWAITCLNCEPAIPTINVNARYEYNLTTGRLDEVLVSNADTGAPIVRRPIKFLVE